MIKTGDVMMERREVCAIFLAFPKSCLDTRIGESYLETTRQFYRFGNLGGSDFPIPELPRHATATIDFFGDKISNKI